MSGSTFGKVFKLTTFGESHGMAIGGIIEGCPPKQSISVALIQKALDRRRPGQSDYTSPRNEKDQIEILSGLYNGESTGTPIGFIIRNEDQRPEDYATMETLYRPSHADFTYEQKYGIRDPRGGGRSSARETACRVVAGAIAAQILENIGVTFSCYVDQIGRIKIENTNSDYTLEEIEKSPVRCPDVQCSDLMRLQLEQLKVEGDTIGGSIKCIINGVPIGLGQPVFDKLHADLGKAMLSINAVKGFEYGSGFDSIEMTGSQHNDIFKTDFTTETNFSGGIQGGISNGMPIYFRVAFKPVATVMKPQNTIDGSGNEKILEPKGRHDACVVPRAVPIVEAMAAIVILDHHLCNKQLSL